MTRRSLVASLARTWFSRGSSAEKPFDKSRRRFAFERLEDRTVLSAVAGTVDSEPPLPCSLDEVAASVQQVQLRINGAKTVLQRSESTVVVNVGDTVEIFEVDYAVERAPASCEAVIAAEAYFRKGVTFDYADGGFGDTRGTDPFLAHDMEVAMKGHWVVGPDWDRMSIPLLGYSDTDYQVYDRFFINFEVVDDRDLAFAVMDTLNALRDELFVVGQAANLQGAWINNSQTHQTVDMAVQVYSTRTGPPAIWTGRFTVTAAPGETVTGTFTDASGNRWRPSESGIFVVRYTVDPDDVLTELFESNNWGVTLILVR